MSAAGQCEVGATGLFAYEYAVSYSVDTCSVRVCVAFEPKVQQTRDICNQL